MAPIKVDPWIRLFDVTEPTLHQKGYTIYKISSTVFPRNCPEAATRVVAWRRFSDLKKLYKGLHALHASLHLKGTFPPFPKDKVFGRFEPDVIEERRQSTLQLLEFVAQFPPLFTSHLFIKFFEGCKKSLLVDEHGSRADGNAVLQPDLVYEPPPSHQIQPPALIDRTSELSATSGDATEQLGGVWRFCQVTDDVSLESTSGDSDGTSPELAANSISAADIALFDPLGSSTSSPDNASPGSKQSASENAWLLSALANCQSPTSSVSKESGTGPDSCAASLDFPRAFADLDDDPSSPVRQARMPKDETEPFGVEERLPSGVEERLPSDAGRPMRTLAPIRFEETWELADDSDGGEPPGDYLMAAARLLTDAQECEAEGDLEGAFSLYKSVVGTLLSGVQEDLDPIRRDAVRRRTAHYLQRAEDIYRKHLAGRETDRVRWAVTRQQKSQMESESQIKLLKSPPSELGRYKVLGVIGKVMLGLDSLNDTAVAIKVLAKSAVKSTGVFMSPWVVPSNVPCMVRLVRFHETRESIFLVLQHAVGGKLWHYIGSYLQGCGSAFPSTEQRLEADGGEGDSVSNVYTGRKLMEAFVGVGDTSTEVLTVDLGRGDCDSANSYVRLFTDTAARLQQRGRAPLAECRYVAARLAQSPDCTDATSDTRTNQGETCSNADGHFLSSDLERRCNDDQEEESWLDLLESVDPDELIAKSQKLMQHVDETLRESNTMILHLPDSQTGIADEYCPNKVFADVAFGRAPDSPRRTTPPGKSADVSQQRRRRLTSDNAFPVIITHRRSSAGSLELRSSRGRHFSSVFRRLDETRNATNAAGLPESCIRVWAAELVVAISSLHEKGIVCRDLKPDNVLLGERGHIVLSYFSQWPAVERSVDPLTKECHYAAPEVGGIFPVTPSCDWWSLGALLFELLTGKTLVSSHPGGFTSHTQLNIPCQLSAEAQDLLRGLLCFNASERLEMESVKAHPFFTGIEWKDIT